MKKTVAALALSASSTAFGLMPQPAETKTICLNVFESDEGALYAGDCDMSRNNEILGTDLLENGCAEDQVALTSVRYGEQWSIEVASCLPPNVVQL